MEITREMLLQAIQEYQQKAEKLRADADAHFGAAQALEQLLLILDAPAQEDKASGD